MTVAVIFLAGATLCLSIILTFFVRRSALRHELLDIPNRRSSHLAPTPRGGGLAIVTASVAAFVTLSAWGAISLPLLLALILGGVGIAAAGFLDDAYSLAPGIRLLAHAAAASIALVALDGLAAVRIGDSLLAFGPAGPVLGGLAIVWCINLFNFMDGIDGIAASEAVFVSVSAASIEHDQVASAAIVFGAACLGFLVWNWPPARIFMGDVGSGFLGYVVSTLAIADGHREPTGVLIWLTLAMVFVADATATLIRRLLRGDPVFQAHRTHAYQWLSRRWNSHARSTLAVLLLDVVWLLPCAICESRLPHYAGWITLLAALPVFGWVVWAGAGQAEDLRRV